MFTSHTMFVPDRIALRVAALLVARCVRQKVELRPEVLGLAFRRHHGIARQRVLIQGGQRREVGGMIRAPSSMRAFAGTGAEAAPAWVAEASANTAPRRGGRDFDFMSRSEVNGTTASARRPGPQLLPPCIVVHCRSTATRSNDRFALKCARALIVTRNELEV